MSSSTPTTDTICTAYIHAETTQKHTSVQLARLQFERWIAAYEADLCERIAKQIEADYLGPDFGRLPDGNDSPSSALHNAFDEGLEHAATIIRGKNP